VLAASVRAAALVIVLAMLVLMSALVIGFLSMVSTERAGANALASSLEARQAAESAVNLVIAQIRDGTTSAERGGTWASQPGTVRTYDEKGEGDQVFKLYSADELRVPAKEYDPVADAGDLAALTSTPASLPDGWVDLNEPVLAQHADEAGQPVTVAHYPILDPSAARPFEGRTAPGSPGIVEGFECAAIDIADPNEGSGGAKVPVLPLPARWLYLLRDGSVGTAKASTRENPIVARLAFWTDDECAKVNVNTASEGTFWDTPSYSSEIETGRINVSGNLISMDGSLNLAVCQPIRNEFQRYPGHPATTSLSPILRWLWPAPPQPGDPDAEFKEAVYRMMPYVAHGPPTSLAGTRISTLTGGYSGSTSTVRAPIDKDRLFATVDEFIFRADRSARDEASPAEPGETPLADFTPDALEKVRFFLTAHSRAPELNLWSKPRVTIWPIHTDPVKRTGFDELFAFCSTLAGRAYYFTRHDPESATNDFSGRNQEVYRYLRRLTDEKVPGWGATLGGKYGQDRDQILTEIFDYIRTVNLVDTGTPVKAGGFAPYTPKFWSGAAGSSRPNDFSGQVTPIRIKLPEMPEETQGLGRFNTLCEASLIFTHRPHVEGSPETMDIVLALETFLVMPGYPAPKETYTVKVTLEEDVQITPEGGTPQPAGFPPIGYNVCNVDASHEPIGRAFMPHRGIGHTFWYFDPAVGSNARKAKVLDSNDATAATPSLTRYPLVSDPIPIEGNTFSFSGGRFRIELYAGLDPSAAPVQTAIVAFRPVQQLEWPVLNADKGKHFSERISKTGNYLNDADTEFGWIRSGDIVRSMEYTGPRTALNEQGDFRLATARTAAIPPEHFQPRSPASYSNPAVRLVHGFKTCNGQPLFGHTPSNVQASEGRLAQGAHIRADRRSDLPEGVNGVRRTDGGVGDWDRGISKTVDGPFSNHVDEGNSYFDLGSTSESYRMPYYHGARFGDAGESYFSPNRMISSPVMFGSLPTGVKRDQPWQTLLFRPDRPGPSDVSHPGAVSPPDHLWLDLFHMPVVEPYAISEPCSTAGKVNLNYEIAPWGYARVGGGGESPWVRRDTGLRSVFKAVKMMAVPWDVKDAAHQEYALDNPHRNAAYRHDIDLDKTLDAVQGLLDRGEPGVVEKGGLFRTASQLCELDLYPADKGVTDFGQFWADHRLTGDNQRERPYSHLYPRLTTRSNTFTVHVRAQVIRVKPSALDASGQVKDGLLREADVQVQSEYRGSSIIERFIDPNDPALTGYDENATGLSGSLEPYYRFRVIATKRFPR
ncbi:MAG: Verru_Chthon cassette protein A, partial [Verrucomicrobiota bacterium]|nr:Verru_Chthon cassette protein A [Verrucomicrobiota bacterium]